MQKEHVPWMITADGLDVDAEWMSGGVLQGRDIRYLG